MGGDMLPLFTAFLIGVVVALLMVIAVALLPRVVRTRAFTEEFYCPWSSRNVMVRFRADEGRLPDRVISCTAFADPTVVTCARQCLAMGGPAASTAADRGAAAGAD